MKKITFLIYACLAGLLIGPAVYGQSATQTTAEYANGSGVNLNVNIPISNAPKSLNVNPDGQSNSRMMMASYVGSFQVDDGPNWTTNPPVLNALEAAALIFGGSPSDYAISTDPNTVDPMTITNTAWATTWGVGGCVEVAENFSDDQGAPGYNDPGGANTATSSYVDDNCIGPAGTNYVWLLPPPVEFCATDTPKPIPATGTSGPMDPSLANVPETGVIGTNPGEYTIENVTLNIGHTWADDLDIFLVAPGGSPSLELSTDNGGSSGLDTPADLVFTDSSTNNITGWGGGAPLSDYLPEGGTFAAAFAGASVNGDWTLTINDDVGGDSGDLFSFCITVSQNPIVPIINCPMPDPLIVDTEPGICTAQVFFSDAVALDPEGGPVTVVQTMGLPSGSDFPLGDTIIEFTATDQQGDQSTCQFTVTVEDNEPPIVTCPNDIVVDNDPGICGAVVNYPDPMVMDNCFFGGGTATYDQTINIQDLTNPMAFSFTGAFTGATGDATLEVRAYGDLDGTGGNTEQWTIFDEDTNTVGTIGATGNFGDQCSSTLFESFVIPQATIDAWAADGMVDFSAEDLTGLINITTLCTADDFLELRLIYDYATSSAPYTVITGFPSGDVFPVGTTLTTLEYTDPGGNAVTCTFNVTVNDVEAPTITCFGQPATVSLTEDFEAASLPAGWSTNVVSGGFDWAFGSGAMPGGADFTTNAAIFDDDAAGSGELDNTVELFSPVADISGSTIADLSFEYSVQDFIGSGTLSVDVWDGAAWQNILFVDDTDVPPTAFGPFDVIPFANPAFQVRFTYDDEDDWAWGAGIDNFQLDYEVPGGTAFDVVLDANGMASILASDLVVLVDDNCGPGGVTITGGGPGGDPFTLPTTLAGGNGNFGNMFDINALNTVTIDSFDIHGDTGATFDVEVYAKSGTWVGSEDNPGAWTLIGTAPGVVSNGDGVTTPLNLMLNYVIPAGETHAFYVTPTDTSSGGFNYTNGTTVGNVFASDANIEFLEGAGKAYPFTGTTFQPRVFNGNILYTASGGAGGTTIDFTCDDVGEQLITITGTDAAGNEATCTATVNVIDDTPPVLVCADVTIEIGPDGTTEINPEDLLGSSPTTFEVITISSDNQSGTEGFTDFEVNVTDAATISFDWDYTTPDGAAFDAFGYILNGVFTELTDPLGPNDQSGNSGPINVNPGDVFGFRSQSDDGIFGAATTTISNFMPGFTGQFDPANWVLTLTNSDGNAFFVEIPGGPLSFDACGITILAVDIDEVTCDDIANSPITITVFGSDPSLNAAACQSQVTVIDALPPEVTCPPDETVDPGPGNLFYVLPDYWAEAAATASDNCTDPLTIFTQDPAPGTELPDGVYTITLCSTDEYGNEGCCTFELTVESVLGADDNELNAAISMYPNPAQDVVTIANGSNILLESARIFDANGKLINTIDLSNMQSETVIDVSTLASGVYMVQITGERSSIVKRLLKE